MTGVSVCNANNGMPARARVQKSIDRVIMVSSVPNGFPPASLLCRYSERDRFESPFDISSSRQNVLIINYVSEKSAESFYYPDT